MHPALQVCLNLVDGKNSLDGILSQAAEVVRNATTNGELEPFLAPGELVRTRMFFCGNEIYIEAKPNARQKASRIKRDFQRIIDRCRRSMHPSWFCA